MSACRRTLRAAALLPVLLLAAMPARSQSDPLDQLLTRTATRVGEFLDQLGNVSCNEQVLQEKINPKGKLEDRVESSFDYLVVTQNQGSEPMLYESRTALREARSKKNISLLVTNGFATQLLVFHAYYQPSFQFERLADVQLNGKTYVQVHFQHVKGRPSPAALLLRGREYPLSLAGTALIDPETGTVEHIMTELGTSADDLGLKSFRSEVDYSAIAFSPGGKPYWLPSQATVEVNTPKQHWKNIHRFTNYHAFSVNVSVEVNLDKLKQKEQ